MNNTQYFVYDDHLLFFDSRNDAEEYLNFIKTDTRANVYRDVEILHPDEATFSGLCVVYSELLKTKLTSNITYLKKYDPMQLLNEDKMEQGLWNVSTAQKIGWIIIMDWMKITRVEPSEE